MRAKPAKIARWRNMVACSKLMRLKKRWRIGKSRTWRMIASRENNRRSTSGSSLNFRRELLEGYQNLETKLVKPFW